ncbi:MAG: DUF805 domain-containing protein [Rhodocyclaceae bacterium]
MAITIDSLKSNYLDVLKNKYVSFQGRASRAEFWQFALVNFIVGIVLGIVDGIIGHQILGSIYSLAVLLPGIGLGIRRLHDTDRSGWWLLISLVPLVGFIVLIVFWAQETKQGANRFGA